MAGRRIFVEASAGPEITVFKDPSRRRSIWSLIGGTVLVVWGVTLLSSVPFGMFPLLLGVFFLMTGVAQAFSLASLVIDRSAQTVAWVRLSPLGRKCETIPFDGVREVLVSNKVLGGTYTGMVVINDPEMEIRFGKGHWDEVMPLARRIAELTESTVRSIGPDGKPRGLHER